jgi:hypothetical protein
MTVKELIEKLQNLPQDHQVILTNDYSASDPFCCCYPVDEVAVGWYSPNKTRGGEFYDFEEDQEDNAVCLLSDWA